MTSDEIIKQLTAVVTNITQGKPFDGIQNQLETAIDTVHDANQKALFQAIKTLAKSHNESAEFVTELSKGNLDVLAPKHNKMLAPYKQLHANLNHLLWQIQRVSEGDYNQRIDFMGDFSHYLNLLIESLKEKQSLSLALQASEEKYRLITENIEDVIWIINTTQQRFTYISPSLVTLRGFTVEEVMGHDLFHTLSPESAKNTLQKINEHLLLFKANPTDYKIAVDQQQQPCKDGRMIWVESVMKFQYNSAGEIEILGVSRNIEQRKQLETEILKQNEHLSELNATKDKFFNIIAHDLKNPFHVIIMFSEHLLQNVMTFDKEKIVKCVEAINSSSKDTYELLENLLEWSRAQTGRITFNPELFILESVVIDIMRFLENMANVKEITITCDIADTIVLNADKNMIAAVLRNLITNAIKYTNKNGKVTIKAKKLRDYVEITVGDTGIGMSEDKAKNLFQVGHTESQLGTENERGSGIGLLLCKEFVTKHSGKIWAESKLGQGSDLKFTIQQ